MKWCDRLVATFPKPVCAKISGMSGFDSLPADPMWWALAIIGVSFFALMFAIFLGVALALREHQRWLDKTHPSTQDRRH